jgi:hypothetical protein
MKSILKNLKAEWDAIWGVKFVKKWPVLFHPKNK